MPNQLTSSVEEVLLSRFPSGTRVVEAHSYRPEYLPYPMHARLQTPSGSVHRCVIKINHRDAMEREILALRILAQLDLSVPQVLADPMPLPSEERTMVVLSELPGRGLPWCGITSLAEADLTCRLMLEGIARLHQLTDLVQEFEEAAAFPQHTLHAEHVDIVAEAGEWMHVDIFQRAIEIVGASLTEAETPLVFSNGDYNPINFLYDGQALCGFVDFEGACFENPHIGFAKFLIWSYDGYGWGTGAKVGLVERYLYSRNISRRAFAPVLVLRCLRHLLREVSIDASRDDIAREHLFQILAEGLQILTRA